MKESKKESSCPPSAKDKNSLLDEEIGMEFLSSWKTSVTGDNSLDLGFDTVSTGKKSKFNFEKLDIDFDLDGDFGKLSSFKVDMSDLDFSCPLKQSAKPKEGSAGKSPGGKLEQEQFTFSFDFNELEKFDFKTATMEGEKTSLNNLNNKEIVPNNKEHDVSKTAFCGSADPFDDGKIEKLQKSTDVSTSKAHSAVNDNVDSALDVAKTGDFSNENIHSGDANSEGLVMPSVESPVQGKTATDNQEEDQQNHSSEKPVSKSTGSFIQQTMTSPDQSIDGNDLAQGVGFSHDISQPMELPQSCLARSDRSQKTDSGTTTQNVSEHDPEIDCLDHETISAESVLQTMPHNNRLSKDSKDSTSKILVQLGSDTVNDNVPQRKEKETEFVYSKYFNRSRKTECGPDTPSSGGKGVAGLSLNRPEKCNSSSVDAEQNDCKVVKIPRPANKVVVEGGSFMLGNERKNKSSKKFGECFGVGAEQNIRMPRLLTKEPAEGGSTIFGSKKDEDIKKIGSEADPAVQKDERLIQKDERLNSNTLTSANSRIVSSSMGSSLGRKIGISEELKGGKNKPNVPSLISRMALFQPRVSANKDLSSATLKREINSLGNMKKNMEIQGKMTPTIVSLIASTERKIPEMSSLKRKILEGSNPDQQFLSPQKRFSQLQSESRDRKDLESNVEGQVSCNDNQTESKLKSILCDHPTSGVDRANKISTKDLMVPLDVENDGNVEKAEAYVKELDAICVMLRTKHDEAKEIMVRAVVNNNRLLMLNHPMFDEKIRRVQKFAARLISN